MAGAGGLARAGALWNRLADGTRGLAGRRRWAAAFALGGISAAALPPFNITPAVLIAFSGLFWLLESCRRPRDGLAAGWAFGCGQFLCGLYWIGHAFLVQAEQFAWLIPFAIGGLCAGLALYPALACWAALRWSGGRPRAGLWLALAAMWAIAEWLRGYLLTGFPWNPIGHVLVWSDSAVQLAAVAGVWGLSLLAVACAAAPALLAAGPKGEPTHGRCVLAAYAVLVLAAGGGAWRLAGADGVAAEAAGRAEPTRLRIVQANIPQAEKWRAEWRRRNVNLHIDLSRGGWTGGGGAAASRPPDLVIWPETAIPYVINVTKDALPLAELARSFGGRLILGGVRTTLAGSGRQVRNSLLAVGADGGIEAVYDKARLVPFGEYIPLQDWIGIGKMTFGAGSFSPGPGPATLKLPGLPAFSPLICYEVIFPARVLDVANRPQWLLNLTNDAWFGASSGPYQHLASARLRAVEEGLPLVRAANTGISAVIDSYGRVAAQLPLGRRGALDAPLPPTLAERPPYARFGDWIFSALLLLLLGLARWRVRGKKG